MRKQNFILTTYFQFLALFIPLYRSTLHLVAFPFRLKTPLMIPVLIVSREQFFLNFYQSENVFVLHLFLKELFSEP